MGGMYGAIRSEITQIILGKRGLGENLLIKLEMMKRGAWPQSLIDCIFQRHAAGGPPTIEDVWVFLNIYCRLLSGEIRAFQIPVGNCPLRDKMVTENNLLLSRLPAPFSGSFQGALLDLDGEVSWDRSIYVPVVVGNQVEWQAANPAAVGLEVGTIDSMKFQHILLREHSKALARWPYGAEHITVFLGAERGCGPHELCEESIEECIDRLDRNPWSRWNDEHSASQDQTSLNRLRNLAIERMPHNQLTNAA